MQYQNVPDVYNSIVAVTIRDCGIAAVAVVDAVVGVAAAPAAAVVDIAGADVVDVVADTVVVQSAMVRRIHQPESYDMMIQMVHGTYEWWNAKPPPEWLSEVALLHSFLKP